MGDGMRTLLILLAALFLTYAIEAVLMPPRTATERMGYEARERLMTPYQYGRTGESLTDRFDNQQRLLNDLVTYEKYYYRNLPGYFVVFGLARCFIVPIILLWVGGILKNRFKQSDEEMFAVGYVVCLGLIFCLCGVLTVQ